MTEETRIKVLGELKNYKTKLGSSNAKETRTLANTVHTLIGDKHNYYAYLGSIIRSLWIIGCNDVNFISPLGNFTKVKEEFEIILDSLILDFGRPEISREQSNKNNKENMIINNNITQTQEQHQTQELSLLECIKDGLGKPDERDKRLEELKKIAQAEPDIEKAKPKIIDKLKDFGDNVCSNIVANILTNPTIWESLF